VGGLKFCAAASVLAVTVFSQEAATSSSRLFFLDIRGGRVVSANADGSDARTLVSGLRGTPDGIVVDADAGYMYWTHMGAASADDGYVQRAKLDGSELTKIVPDGDTFTPKQLKLDTTHHKLYWSDREGMRVMRADVDGTHVETLIETGHGDADRANQANWCVGIALDVEGGKIYWTQKGGNPPNTGSIRRANLDVPHGMDAAHRGDGEILIDNLPEPIDLDLDLRTRTMYWTDRGDPPRGNTVARAPMDPPPGFSPSARSDVQILFGELKEGIGIALDTSSDRLYVTDLGGNVYAAHLDGSDHHTILTAQGSLTGIAVAYPKERKPRTARRQPRTPNRESRIANRESRPATRDPRPAISPAATRRVRCRVNRRRPRSAARASRRARRGSARNRGAD
jgi:hypothetical protein